MDYLLCGDLPYPAWKKRVSAQGLSNRRIRRYLVCRLKRPEARGFSHVRFTIQWVTACAYEKGVGLAVKMNPLLKPFLLGLQERYTQYQLENILAMKSVYAIRIYELLMKEQMTRFIPADGVSVILAIKTIREACDCETKYEKISQFKSKVIDIAVKEICRCTSYTVSYECLKKGRSIEAFRFHLNSKYNKIY